MHIFGYKKSRNRVIFTVNLNKNNNYADTTHESGDDWVRNKLDEFAIGQLLYFFEKACGISGYILDVNPFDQPGVEAYKKNMFALLEKPGFEEETRKIKDRL